VTPSVSSLNSAEAGDFGASSIQPPTMIVQCMIMMRMRGVIIKCGRAGAWNHDCHKAIS
jgi:hypothetical protein